MREIIDEAWEDRAHIDTTTQGTIRVTVQQALDGLDDGSLRVAGPTESGWHVHQWLKKAVLLSFRLNQNALMAFGPINAAPCGPFYDKVPLKFTNWKDRNFQSAGIRVVPGSVVRRGAFIGRNAILMPSFVNIGAWIGEGTLVDTWATIGSCAQIGKNCHISGGAGIGGVLEPVQAEPVIIEDDCFIGARSEVVEGVIVRSRAVLSMGVFIGKNTPIVDRTKDSAITYGEIPPNAVVMTGVHPGNGLICPQIVKYRDERTDAATALNEALRG